MQRSRSLDDTIHKPEAIEVRDERENLGAMILKILSRPQGATMQEAAKAAGGDTRYNLLRAEAARGRRDVWFRPATRPEMLRVVPAGTPLEKGWKLHRYSVEAKGAAKSVRDKAGGPEIFLSRLGVKSQTVVPKAVRDALGIGPGDRIGYRIEDGRVELVKFMARGENPLACFDEWSGEADTQGYASF